MVGGRGWGGGGGLMGIPGMGIAWFSFTPPPPPPSPPPNNPPPPPLKISLMPMAQVEHCNHHAPILEVTEIAAMIGYQSPAP